MHVFSKKQNKKDFYHPGGTLAVEPDFRQQLHELLFHESRRDTFIYRRTRRDANGYPILAPELKNNRSGETLYTNNYGMKYLFDDYACAGYFSIGEMFHDPGSIKSYGDSRTEQKALYIEYNTIAKITQNKYDIPDELDKIIIPKFDIDGNIASPIVIKEMYDIGSALPYRLDNSGRVEYVRINLLSKFDESITL